MSLSTVIQLPILLNLWCDMILACDCWKPQQNSAQPQLWDKDEIIPCWVYG